MAGNDVPVSRVDIPLTELDLKEKASQFNRPNLGAMEGRQMEGPGNMSGMGGYSMPDGSSGYPALDGADPPVDRTSPFKPRSTE